MPLQPRRPCTYPGCNNLITGGARCAKHPYDKPSDTRPTAAKRGYDKTWKRLRAYYLSRHPMCESCQTRPAELVDHIIPLKAGGARLDEDNLQALCRKCHGYKTAVEDPKHKRAYQRDIDRASDDVSDDHEIDDA